MLCTKNVSMYDIRQSVFILSWLSQLTHNAMLISWTFIFAPIRGQEFQELQLSPDNASCHPEYHPWKVRRPKCRPPWPADRILSGPRSSLSFKGLSTNPLLVFSVLFLTEFQEDFSLPKGCKQPPCCSCFCSS